MNKVASIVNQESTAPTAGSAEWSLWLEYLNRATHEWSEVNDWEEMRKSFFPAVTSSSQATVTLPLDFKKLAASPRLHDNVSTESWTEFPDISKETQGLYVPTDNYVTQGGNINTGYFLSFHPATLSSGASLEVQYFSMPTSLASPSDIPVVTDIQFLVDRAVAYIFEARSDPRFQQEEQKARDRLIQMIENSNLSKYSSYGTPAPVINTLRRAGFRVGRN